MDSKKKYHVRILLLICIFLLCGCSKGQKINGPGTGIYYVNASGSSLVKEEYEIKGDTVEEEIEDVIGALKKEPDSYEYHSVFSREIYIEEWKLTDGKLDIHFNSQYSEMSRTEEVILRAAVVQSLGQVTGVDYVYFFIGNEPLKDSQGKEVGYMRAEDFVQNTGSSLHSYQVGDLNLYFANKQGDKLVKESVSVRYNSNMSKEKLIVEQLIKGPSSGSSQSVIPVETKVLGVSVKDHICYVNLDEGFLNNTYVIDPELTIYAIVNSIVEGGSSSKVQISVNGKSDINYMGKVDLSKPLSRNLEIVEEESN